MNSSVMDKDVHSLTMSIQHFLHLAEWLEIMNAQEQLLWDAETLLLPLSKNQMQPMSCLDCACMRTVTVKYKDSFSTSTFRSMQPITCVNK